MSSEDQFDKIADAVNEKFVAVVKDTLDQSKITDLKGFYDAYRQEQLALNEEFASPQNQSPKPELIKLELFADVYKYLDVFPPNLQKPKKQPAIRERLNSTISKSSPSLNDLTHQQQNNTSTVSLNAIKFEHIPKPTDTYKNFQKFQKQLHQLSQDIADNNIDKSYANKLQLLHNFAQQLQKVLPKEKIAPAALTPNENEVLQKLVDKMEDMNFIRDNQDIYHQSSNAAVFHNTQRLDSLVEILTHSLIALNSFKIVY